MFYKGKADWGAIRAVKDAVTCPVVANGDVESLSDARAMLAQSGADAVMIGRASLGQPWLVGSIAARLAGSGHTPPPPAARREAALEHLDSLLAALGSRSGLRHARKHLAAYADRADAGEPRSAGRARDRLRLVTTEDPREACRLLASFFDPSFQEAA
jgi:tRNA-dihydrouridine synthase